MALPTVSSDTPRVPAAKCVDCGATIKGTCDVDYFHVYAMIDGRIHETSDIWCADCA